MLSGLPIDNTGANAHPDLLVNGVTLQNMNYAAFGASGPYGSGIYPAIHAAAYDSTSLVGKFATKQSLNNILK